MMPKSFRYLILAGLLLSAPASYLLDAQSRVNPSASISADITGADGAIVDGDSAVEADVFDLTNSNSLAVSIVDGSGDAITSFGGGTQYAVDAALGATPTGTLSLAIRDDALSTLTPVEGDAIGLRVGSTGALWTTVTGTVTVGSHAVTNAGTFATQVDGSALTALQLIDNLVLAEDAVHASAAPGLLPLAVRQDSHSDLAADGDYIPFTIDADGGLRVSIVAGAGSGGTAGADDFDFTAGTTSFTPMGGFYQSSVTACTDGDACAAGITTGRAVKVALSNADGSLVTYQADLVFGTATYTEATTSGPLVGAVRNDTLATLVNTDNEVGPLQMNASGALYVEAALSATDNGVLDNIDADTTLIATGVSASTQHYRTSAGSTEDEFEVKATAGVLTGGIITNTAATVAYLKCANLTAANTTPGSSTVFFAAAIPGATTGAGFNLPIPPGGITFSTALTCWIVTGEADSDTTEVGADDVKINLFYR